MYRNFSIDAHLRSLLATHARNEQSNLREGPLRARCCKFWKANVLLAKYMTERGCKITPSNVGRWKSGDRSWYAFPERLRLTEQWLAQQEATAARPELGQTA
jgi:hypothetical protein